MRRAIFVISTLLLLITINVSASSSVYEKGTRETAKTTAASAARYFTSNGVEEGIKAIHKNSGEYRDGAIYIFLYNYKTGVMEGHGANKSLVGKNLMNMKDADGKMFFHEMTDIIKTKGEGWVEYKWPNPVSKKIEQKSTYIIKINDTLLIGCGYYKN